MTRQVVQGLRIIGKVAQGLMVLDQAAQGLTDKNQANSGVDSHETGDLEDVSLNVIYKMLDGKNWNHGM